MEENKKQSKTAGYINRGIAILILVSFFIVFAQRTYRHGISILQSVRGSFTEFIESEEPRFRSRALSLYDDLYKSIKGGIMYFYSYPPRERDFIHMHFEYLKATGRGHYNGVTFLTDGRLILDTQNPILWENERSDSILGLHDFLASQNTPFLYVRIPNKLRDNSLLPFAFANNRIIENGNSLMELISSKGMDTFDLRAEMMRDNFDFENGFYRTHIHWTNKTVLWASQKLGALMNEKYGFNVDLSIWDLDKYDQVTYERVLRGNQADPVGAYGLQEDVTLLFPRFPIDIEFSSYNTGYAVTRSDNFVELFLPNIYKGGFEFLECHDIRIPGAHFTHFVNHEATEDKHILIIADSFSLSWAMYLPLGIKNVDFIYLIQHRTPAEIWDWLEGREYDLAFIAVSDVIVSIDALPVFEDDRLYLGNHPVR